MEDAIVLYPSPGMGHLFSMVEQAKLILTHHPNSFSITVLIISPPPNSVDISRNAAGYLSAVSEAFPAISFRHLPPPAGGLPPDLSFPELCLELARLNNPGVLETLEEISRTSSLKAFVVDFFCDDAFEEVSPKLDGVPTYYYITGGACGLALLLYLQTIDEETEESLGDMGDRFLAVPGFPEDCLRASDVPSVNQDRSSKLYAQFLRLSVNLTKCGGIAVNTFEALEKRALEAISGGLCAAAPAVFAVGPVVSGAEEEEKSEWMTWLDSQAEESVVFLCFGSMGAFSSFQLREIAAALERCGRGFLWVVRDPPGEPVEALSVLPEGFVERTRARGRVVEGWAPQARVLAHPAVGLFVTHCGWNSVLEAVVAGVPMLAWPLYAEQRLNAAAMVREMKVALPIPSGTVSSAELEERVEELMSGSERGREVRDTVRLMSHASAEAMESRGGSSRVAFTRLTEQWKQNP